jgi:hypothetical protein
MAAHSPADLSSANVTPPLQRCAGSLPQPAAAAATPPLSPLRIDWDSKGPPDGQAGCESGGAGRWAAAGGVSGPRAAASAGPMEPESCLKHDCRRGGLGGGSGGDTCCEGSDSGDCGGVSDGLGGQAAVGSVPVCKGRRARAPPTPLVVAASSASECDGSSTSGGSGGDGGGGGGDDSGSERSRGIRGSSSKCGDRWMRSRGCENSVVDSVQDSQASPALSPAQQPFKLPSLAPARAAAGGAAKGGGGGGGGGGLPTMLRSMRVDTGGGSDGEEGEGGGAQVSGAGLLPAVGGGLLERRQRRMLGGGARPPPVQATQDAGGVGLLARRQQRQKLAVAVEPDLDAAPPGATPDRSPGACSSAAAAAAGAAAAATSCCVVMDAGDQEGGGQGQARLMRARMMPHSASRRPAAACDGDLGGADAPAGRANSTAEAGSPRGCADDEAAASGSLETVGSCTEGAERGGAGPGGGRPLSTEVQSEEGIVLVMQLEDEGSGGGEAPASSAQGLLLRRGMARRPQLAVIV